MTAKRITLGWVAISVIVGLLYVQASFDVGRLAHTINYDDIAYVNDASDRMAVLHGEGWGAFFGSFATESPHSPYTTILALLALSLFGYQDAGFYLINIGILAAATAFLVSQFREYGWAICGWVCAFFLASPLAYATVENFKPDISLGLATGAFIWFVLNGALNGDRRALLYAGLCFGAALLIKPTFFAHTLAMGVGGLGLATMLAIWQKRLLGEAYGLRWFDPLLRFFLLGCAVAAPYYAVSAWHVFEYFWVNTQGRDAHLWSFPSTDNLLTVALSFIQQGYLQNGGYLLHFAWVIVLVGGAVLAARREWRGLTLVVLLTCSAGASFAILVVGRHMNHAFFASFIVLMFLAAFASVAKVIGPATAILRHVSVGVLAIFLVVLVASGGRFYPEPGTTEDIRPYGENARIAAALASRANELGRGTSYMDALGAMVTVPGPVNAHTLKWEARKLGVFLKALDASRSGDVNRHLAALETAAFVVVPSSPNAEYFQAFPSAAIQDEIYVSLRDGDGFEPLPNIPTSRYAVFEREGLQASNLFDLPHPSMVQGFRPVSGPFPQWGLPRLRWMISDVATICVYEPGAYSIEFVARGAAPEITLSFSGTQHDESIVVLGDQALVRSEVAFVSSPEIPCFEIRAAAASPLPRYAFFTSIRGRLVEGGG